MEAHMHDLIVMDATKQISKGRVFHPLAKRRVVIEGDHFGDQQDKHLGAKRVETPDLNEDRVRPVPGPRLNLQFTQDELEEACMFLLLDDEEPKSFDVIRSCAGA